jgi:hypothetical protein
MAQFHAAQPKYMHAELDSYADNDKKKNIAADTNNAEKNKKFAASTFRGRLVRSSNDADEKKMKSPSSVVDVVSKYPSSVDVVSSIELFE